MRGRWLAGALVALSTVGATRALAQGGEAMQEMGPTVEAQVGTAVVDRQLQGAAESFPASVGTVYCFIKVGKTQAGSTIEAVWYHGDTEVGRKELNIGGSPWRTWSSKIVPPEATGDWHVDIVAAGKVVQTVKFTVQ